MHARAMRACKYARMCMCASMCECARISACVFVYVHAYMCTVQSLTRSSLVLSHAVPSNTIIYKNDVLLCEPLCSCNDRYLSRFGSRCPGYHMPVTQCTVLAEQTNKLTNTN